MCAKLLQLCRLFATPWTAARQAPLSTEFSRQEYWGGLLCLPPGGLPNPGIEPVSFLSPAWRVDSLPIMPPGKLRAHSEQLSTSGGGGGAVGVGPQVRTIITHLRGYFGSVHSCPHPEVSNNGEVGSGGSSETCFGYPQGCGTFHGMKRSPLWHQMLMHQLQPWATDQLFAKATHSIHHLGMSQQSEPRRRKVIGGHTRFRSGGK